jgi:hypothetical protein
MTFCEKFKEYLWLMWDGVGFFGTSELKLDRLKGKEPRWYDPFKNMRWMALNLIIFAIVSIVLKSGFDSLATIKSQEIRNVYQKTYTFDIRGQMPLIGAVYFKQTSLMAAVNKILKA